jgi:hypothetical protein
MVFAMQYMKNGMMQVAKERVNYQILRFRELMEEMGEPVRLPATGLDIEDLFRQMGKSINSRKEITPPTFGSFFSDEIGKENSYSPGGEYYNEDWEVYGWHPVFSMMQHFRGNDSGDPGYTKNNYRGDHISIPIYSEGGWGVYVLEISFHKGSTFIDVIGFPNRPIAVVQELYELLQDYETR